MLDGVGTKATPIYSAEQNHVVCHLAFKNDNKECTNEDDNGIKDRANARS